MNHNKQGTTKPAILFMAKSDYSYDTLVPIIREAQKRDYSPVALIYHSQSDSLKQKLSGIDVPWIEKSYHKKSLLPFYYRHLSSYAKQILVNYDPVALVGISEKKIPEIFLLNQARKKSVPFVLVQWAFTYPQDYYESLRTKNGKQHGFLDNCFRFYNDLINRLWKINNIYSDAYGGGRGDVFCVIGPHFAHQAQKQGIPEEKIKITGHPFFDRLYELERSPCNKLKESILQKLDVPSNKLHSSVILYTSQPLTHFKITDANTQKEEMLKLVNILSAKRDHLVVIKLHPREDIGFYPFLSSKYDNVKIVRDFDLAGLMRISDLVISRFSTTLLYAVAMKKPVIILDTVRIRAKEYYSQYGAAVKIADLDHLARTIDEISDDEKLRAKLCQGCERMQKDFFIYDGMIRKMIMDIVE